METEIFDVLIAGGGLAGLTCAYQLRNRRVLLCEKENALGGRIRTLVREGLAYDMGAVLAYQQEYVPFALSSHQLHHEKGPIGVAWDSKLFYGETVLGCLETIFQDDRSQFEDIGRFEKDELSIDRLKKRNRNILNAFFQGIHPGEIEDYIALRRKDAFERYDPSHYLDGNYGLIEELRNHVSAEIRLNTKVRSVKKGNGHFLVSLREGKENKSVKAKAVIAATTASAAATLLSPMRGIELDFLRSIRYGSFVTVAIGTRANFEKDFSYIVMPERLVTTIYKMSFPGTDRKVLLFFYCDKASKEIFKRSDAEVVLLTLQQATTAGLSLSKEHVIFSDVIRWEEGGTIISPVYYKKWESEAFNPSQGIYLAGDYLYKALPYGMEAALRSGEDTGKAVDTYLAKDDDPLDRVLELGSRAVEASLPMTCHPPFPAARYAYGDLVPLGFLLRALQAAPGDDKRKGIVFGLRTLLEEKKQDGLWAFHTSRLVTSTDSSLVMLGVQDAAALEALDAFYDGSVGYFPQLWSEEREPGKMEAAFNNRHWCRVDFATTCLIRYQRREVGLPCTTPLRFLEDGFNRRSSLFFANPFLTDWFLALSLKADEESRQLRERLAREVFRAQNSDDSFGRYDIRLSTALAVLTLCELDYRNEKVHRAIKFLEHPPASASVSSIPFYSADRIDYENYSDGAWLLLTIGNGERIVSHEGKFYAVTLYEDGYGMITTSLVYLARRAVAEGKPSAGDHAAEGELPSHPRYRCETPTEYVARYALLPYLDEGTGEDRTI
jgi:protoporphyrinogen oxidase